MVIKVAIINELCFGSDCKSQGHTCFVKTIKNAQNH